ncbi:putative gtp-binding protein obgm [Quercus suber]|uniref:Gtp-binding protein obgm n=1 Tax=Quercus suber TaxID=58331 RepID=A0AAW0M0S3_QUESU
MWMRCVKPLWQLEALRQSSKSPWLFSLFSLYSDTPHRKSKLAPLQERKMIDRFRLYAKGGDGGNGCSSLRRGRQDRRGRPDGGNGGKGGDVILECSPQFGTSVVCNIMLYLWCPAGCKQGGQGASKNMIGTRGEDKVLFVPVGTVVHLMEGEIPSVVEKHYSTELDPWEIPETVKKEEMEEEEQMLYNVAELTEQGQQIIVARGGQGGLGNIATGKGLKKPKSMKDNNFDIEASNDDQASLSTGFPGSESTLVLELKSIADVSLVGMPNAGKSTLLGAISRAKPSVGHYAFTTLRPNLGNLNYDDLSITVADVPGLIKGAHENRGLGHAFLRHIERTKVLAYVVDLAAGLDGRKGVPPWEQLRDLILELEYHQKVANKIDEKGAEEVYEVLKKRVPCVPIFPLEALRQSSKSPWLFSLFSLYSDTPHRKSKLAPLQEVMVAMVVPASAVAGKIVVADLMVGYTLISIITFDSVAANKGGQGASKNMIGTRGEDKVLFVPVGTVVHLMEGEIPSVVEKHYSTELDPWEIPETVKKEEMEEEEQMLYNVAELTEQGQQIIVARGGQGGLGNIATGKGLKKPKSMKDNNFDIEASNDDQASLSTGFPGSESTLVLELKSIADVSLVGMPNAGKSTLLGAISRAKPSVGHYAFTTLRPNLGNLNYDDLSITVADVPGLIKGAHENRGLGHAFLRHIERTKVLAYVVDLAAGLDGRKGVPPWEQLRDLILELEYHQKGLSDRPSLIVANKIDEKGAEEVYEVLKKRVPCVPIFPVCAVLEEGIEELKTGLKGLMNGQISCRLRLDEILLD